MADWLKPVEEERARHLAGSFSTKALERLLGVLKAGRRCRAEARRYIHTLGLRNQEILLEKAARLLARKEDEMLRNEFTKTLPAIPL